MKHYDVAIIGAGTSGLTARRQIQAKTDNYVVIDDGPLGTTCARVGCMPSKVLIQVANDFARRIKFEQEGILGGENLHLDTKRVMQHVRKLRDRFTSGVKNPMKGWEDKLVRKRARFVDTHTLELISNDTNGDEPERITADKIIIATGSRPILPAPWRPFKEYLIDTNQFFEISELPPSMAVIGLGVIGIELGQALSRLGVSVIGITKGKAIGGLTDPEIVDYVFEKFQEEFPISAEGAEIVGAENGQLLIKVDGEVQRVSRALVAVGRQPNLDKLGLEALNIDHKQIEVDRNTTKLKGFDHIFVPGDVNSFRPILHEAADEGFIAGYNSVNNEECFKRRVPLGITFSDPNIATVGQTYQQLKENNVAFVTGKVSFEGQGRSIVKLKEQGMLHVYAEQKTGLLLGAELQAPDGEHLAHLLAWALSVKLSVFETLKMPFYHPVIEEGLRTALRNAAEQVCTEERPATASGIPHYELFRCQDSPIR